MLLCRGWNGEVESRALARFRFDPDFSAVPLDDLFANSQTDAAAGIRLSVVEALEDDENALCIFHVYAEPIVSYRNYPKIVFSSWALNFMALLIKF